MVLTNEWEHNNKGLLYKSEALKDFADYTVNVQLAITGQNYNGNNVTPSFFLVPRATVGSSGTEMLENVTHMSLRVAPYGGVSIQKSWNNWAQLPEGYTYKTTFHSLADSGLLKHNSTTFNPGYVLSANNLDNDPAGITADDVNSGKPRTMEFKFSGVDVVYKLDGNTVLNTAESIKALNITNYDVNAVNEPAYKDAADVNYNVYKNLMSTVQSQKGTVALGFSRGAEFVLKSLQVKIEVTSLPAMNDFYTISDASPALPMFAHTKVKLADVVVEFADGSIALGGNLEWSAPEGIIVNSANGEIIAIEKDTHTVTVTKDETTSRKIYVMVNEKDDYNFYLVDIDLTDDSAYDSSDWMLAQTTSYPAGGAAITDLTVKEYINDWNAWNMSSPTKYDYLYLFNSNANSMVFYNAPILEDFKDYNLIADIAFANDYDANSVRGLIFNANVDFTAAVGTSAFGDNGVNGTYMSQERFGTFAFGSLDKTPYGKLNRGLEQVKLHSLEGEEWKKTLEGSQTSDYSIINNTKNSRRIVDVTLSGDDIIYKLENKEILNTTKNVYKLSGLTSAATSTLANYEADILPHLSTRTSGNAIGFQQGQGGLYLYDLQVKLNVSSKADMPAYSDIFALSADTPFIPMTEGTVLAADFLFTTSAGKVDAISNYAWVSDKEGVSYSAATGFTATKPGAYKLTAGTETIYIVVKGINDTDYTVFEADYRNAGTTVTDTWTTYIYYVNGSDLTRMSTGNTNKAASGTPGFQPYTVAEIQAAVGSEGLNYPSGTIYSTITVLENDLVNKLSDYKIDSTVYVKNNARASFGLVGRVNMDGSPVVSGMTLGGTTSYWGSKPKEVVYNNGRIPTVNDISKKEWYYITDTANLRLKEFSLTLNGDQMTYSAFGVGDADYKYTVESGKGTAGIAQTSLITGSPVQLGYIGCEVYIYDFKVTVPASDVSIAGLNFKNIDNHTPYTASGAYAVIPSSDAQVDNATAAERIDKITYTGTSIVDVRFPATVGGTAITKLGSAQGGWSATTNGTGSVIYNLPVRNVYIDNAVTLGANAFSYTNAEKLVFPTTAKSVAVEGLATFRNSYKLLKIENISALKTFGYQQAFQNNYSLAEVVVPDHITNIPAETFRGAKSLGIAKLPEGITEIKDNAFLGAHSLHTINFPTALTKIGVTAFTNCYSLESAELPETLTTIGSNAFKDSLNLKEVTIYSPNVTIAGPATSSNWAFNTAGMTIKGYKGSTAEAYVTAYNAAYPEATINFEPLNTAVEASQNSVVELPATFAGLEVEWALVSGNAEISADGTKVAIYGAVGETVELKATATYTTDEGESTLETTLTITVTAFDAEANNFLAGTDATVAKVSDGKYSLTFEDSYIVDYSKLKIDGIYGFTKGDEAGNVFLFTAASLADVKITYLAETDTVNSNSKFYNLGAQIRTEGVPGLGFVTRSTAIAQKDLLGTVSVNGQSVKPILVGAMLAPQKILDKGGTSLELTEHQVTQLATGGGVPGVLIYSNGTNDYYAQHLVIDSLTSTTDKFGDYRVVLQNVPDSMKSQQISYVTYMIYEIEQGTYGIIYSDVMTKTYAEVSSAIAQ